MVDTVLSGGEDNRAILAREDDVVHLLNRQDRSGGGGYVVRGQCVIGITAVFGTLLVWVNAKQCVVFFMRLSTAMKMAGTLLYLATSIPVWYILADVEHVPVCYK
jgi:hypothetical protein